MPLAANTQPRDFNPRPPRGGRLSKDLIANAKKQFQSTSSARRTTPTRHKVDKTNLISIHVLREEDDPIDITPSSVKEISIHVLREEDDRRRRPTRHHSPRFQSTSSARRTT